MTEETATTAGTTTLERSAFARVLAQLMEARGIPADQEHAVKLAEESGLNPEIFRRRLDADLDADPGDLLPLAKGMTLSGSEMRVLALAYAFEEERDLEDSKDLEELSSPRVPRPEDVLEDLEERSADIRPRPLRCRSGSSSSEMGQCPRDATTWMFPEVRDYPLCEEHARLYELANEVHYRETACLVTEDWLRLARAWGHEDLERMAQNAHEEAKLEFLKAQAKADLAKEIADAPRKGDERPTLTREQDEKLRELMRRGDSLNDAYTTVEDAPEERLRDEARERILAVLASERDKGWEEFFRYKEELGLEVRTSEDRQPGREAEE